MKDTLGRENRKHSNKRCRECQKSFRPKRASSRYCSRPCAWANNGGHNRKQESWKMNSKGYIEGRIWLPDGTQIQVKQHRYIMAGILGRPLKQSEDVHHVNGNKSDNRPENLEVIDHGEHSRITNNARTYKRGYKVRLSSAERKARSLRAIAMGLYRLGQAAIAKEKKKKRDRNHRLKSEGEKSGEERA